LIFVLLAEYAQPVLTSYSKKANFDPMKLFHQRWFSIPKDKISAFILNIAKKPGKITAFG
jgi:hypothetical protein